MKDLLEELAAFLELQIEKLKETEKNLELNAVLFESKIDRDE